MVDRKDLIYLVVAYKLSVEIRYMKDNNIREYILND